MNKRFLRLKQFCVFGLDLISLNVLIMLQQFGMLWFETFSNSQEYTRLNLWLNTSWLVVLIAGNLYSEKYISSFELFFRRTIHTYFFWLVLVLVYLFFAHQFKLSLSFVAFLLCSQGAMLLVNRCIYLVVRSYLCHYQYFTRRVLILGYNDTAKKLVSYLEEENERIQILGFCEEAEHIQELTHYPILGPLEKAMELSEQMKVDEIFSTIAPEHDLGIYQLMQQANQCCIRFKVIPDLSLFMNHSFHIDYLNDMPVLCLRREPLDEAGNRILKRLFDIVVSLFVVIFILPWLVPVVGLLIWIESPGPIFFKQKRTGRNNKQFQCLKFRSMKINNDADMKQATQNDERLTKVGSFLRRTSLDEFPQFLNVLIGNMSVVGPRPHMLKHTNDYSKLIQEYMVRQFVKPGMTGWAQVNGYRGEIKTLQHMKRRVNYDLWYAENWSMWLDIKIVFFTMVVMIKSDQNAC
ncbi:undecaprenyl-phosphate glucose phosphotransferase [Chitinophagaceae bacterium LB-8]|uniref:Undecaprenyl-phosphate glucose phosphotransferase n=1 Tax=Paraflavisolibacter caeni TaxID=2982496 RepID=A0A9X3BGC0_9BACT|nr:undecaprenyl-phosphate glucose phosphotransferase [Paraflavisolibacter caeni]MCU7547507.1 undecaprenyl-phosphate glucose phosphotransferase [Paraflavisolibacter caeni]